jgi:guanine nucleotide-binding protein subunit beta-2-like 1 protein
MIVTASRDKTLIKWDVSATSRTSVLAGKPVKSLVGHSDFVQDVQCSQAGDFALSGSWDNTLALWDLRSGDRLRVFKGHSNDVLSVAFSPTCRLIVSGSRDGSIRVWNTIAEEKGVFDAERKGHNDWVSCVRFTPDKAKNVVVTGGHDGKVKTWSLGQDWGHKHTFDAHDGYVSSICISPDGSLCASGGKDGVATLWDLTETRRLYDFSNGGPISYLVFSPDRYWLSVAAGSVITVYDLESRSVAATLKLGDDEDTAKKQPEVTCLAWSHDGSILYAGFTDNLVHSWTVDEATNVVQ